MFERWQIPTREPPASSDINLVSSYSDATLREVLRLLLRQRAGNGTTGTPSTSGSSVDFPAAWGFLADGFMPRHSADMTLVLKAGCGFRLNSSDVPTNINGNLGVNDLSILKPLVLPADVEVPLAIGGAQPRIDLIEVRVARSSDTGQSRPVYSAVLKKFIPNSLYRRLNFDNNTVGNVLSPSSSTAPISVKRGAEAGPVPSVTPGYCAVAYVYVAAGATTLSDAVIADRRPLLLLGNDIVSWTVQVGAGVNGGLNTVYMTAPPGVRACIIDRKADSTAGYDVVVFAGRNTDAFIAGSNSLLTALGITDDNAGSTAGAVKPVVTSTLTTLSSLATDLADAGITFPTTMDVDSTAYVAFGDISIVVMRVDNMYVTPSAASYALPGSMWQQGSLRLTYNT